MSVPGSMVRSVIVLSHCVNDGGGAQMPSLEYLVRLSMLEDYGPDQLAGFLGLERFQLDRAREAGLIGPPDRKRRWSAALAREMAGRVPAIIAEVGRIPDLGAGRAAAELTERLGVDVAADGVAELARRGLIGVVGEYKGWPLYDGQDVEALTDAAAAADATRAGELRTAGKSAAYLRIRRADMNHLIRAGLIEPAGWGHGPYDNRRTFSVPLYRTGDLDQLAARTDIDWTAVRAAAPGCRSPLASLPTPARTATRVS
jgi:hypothetical protein